MRQNPFFFLLILTLLPFISKAEWIPLNKQMSAKSQPKVTLLSDDNSGTTLKIDITGFELKDVQLGKQSFQVVDLLTDIFAADPGYAELPYISKVLAIPDDASVSVEVLETSKIQTFKNIHLPPARESWIEGEEQTAWIENSEMLKSAQPYPKNQVELGIPSVFRDFRIARLSVFPVRYIAANHEIEVISSMTIRVNYDKKGLLVNPKQTAQKAIAPSFAKLYNGFIFNYREVLNRRFNGQENGHELMLCIMQDDFVSTFQAYADWKRQSGTDIHITKFSDIGANAYNPNIIKDHIAEAYQTWEVPPTYVLLVGDENHMPIKIVNYDYSFPNEDYFVEIEGDDFFPEMMIGRLSNQNNYELEVMTSKALKYEKNPYTDNTDWFKKATCCSNNAYASQVKTKRFTKDIMLEYGNFTSVDTLMSDGSEFGGGCTVNLNDVKNAINEGRSYLNYRGEGWSTGWQASCYLFGTGDVSSLNNGEQMPFVTSIGCGVAMFENGGNCFGEEWVKLGTPENPRGAIAFVGPTSNTHTTYNNRIDKGIYAGMFQEGMETPGQALLRGKLYMYNVYGSDPSVEYHYRVYCILGDPSVHIWKDIPLEITVDHPSSIPVGFSQTGFTVTHTASGLPVGNAQVCLSNEEIFVSGRTDSTGHLSLGLTTLNEGTLNLTVRGGNVIPFQGNIDIVQMPEYVAPENDPHIVDIDGNLDGLINPNENANITFRLKNWGTQTASNVQATLSALNANFVEIVSTEPVQFGNMASGASVTGDPFQFFVKPVCTVGQIIALKLNVSSDNETWEYTYKIELQGCALNYLGNLIDDEGSLFENYRLEPGETANVILTIDNLGNDIAPNVAGLLRSVDEYITIEDSIGFFSTLEINSTAMNEQDYFRVSVDPSCPMDYIAKYSLLLNTQDGNYHYETLLELEIPVGAPSENDYTGPDAYGYYAYSNTDSLYTQAPTFDWFEIKDIGTKIDVPTGESEYTETIKLSFPFLYYGFEPTHIRISTDGWAAFGSGNQTSYTNTGLPNNDYINSMLACFWDDLFSYNNEIGEIYSYFDELNNRFVIEWNDVSHFGTGSSYGTETFQIVLLDPEHYPTPTGDGEIIYQYKNVVNATNNTIGIENQFGDIGLEYLYNNSYDKTASKVENKVAIKFTTVPPSIWLGIDDNKEPNIKTESGAYLEQNYPNPFSQSTSIAYYLSEATHVSLQIFNIDGKLVAQIEDAQKSAGRHTISWDGIGENKLRLNSGVYFYQIKTNDFTGTKKLLMLK
jgi:peptidase C25-like protein/flagellar hook capping protein FlgD